MNSTLNFPLQTGDTECLRRAAEIVARSNDWDVPERLGDVLSWPLEQRREVMSLAQNLKVKGYFAEPLNCRTYDREMLEQGKC
jgi:hypothetical protein